MQRSSSSHPPPSISALQAKACIGASLTFSFPSNTHLSVRDTAAGVETLTPSQIGQLPNSPLHITTVTATGGPVILSTDQATAYGNGITLSVPANQTVQIQDTAANIANFLASGELTLATGQTGFTSFLATDANDVTLSAQTALTLETANPTTGGALPIAVQTGQNVILSDSASDIENLTAAQLGGLAAVGVTEVDVTGSSVTLTLAQALALYDPIPITVPMGDQVIVTAAAGDLAALTPTQIAGLANIGVTQLQTSGIQSGGTYSIAGGITLDIDGAAPAGTTIAFAGAGTLQLDDTQGFAALITGLAPSDIIDLTDLGNAAAVLTSGNTLDITAGTVTNSFTLDPNQVFPSNQGDPNPPVFRTSADAGTGTNIQIVETTLTTDFSLLAGQNASGVTIGANGLLAVSAGASISNTTILAGGTLDLNAGQAGTGTITFAGPGATLQIDDTTLPAATIAGFVNGDFVTAPNITATTAAVVNTNTLDLLDTNANLLGALVFDPATTSVTALEADLDVVALCYVPGTLIQTDHGEVPIENLRETDRVLTASGHHRPIVWVGRRAYDGRFIKGNKRILPITIQAGALAEGIPARDLTVSPLHAIYLEGVLIDAQHLINGVTITQAETVDSVTYYNLELDTHDVIFANGAAAESFVGDECRNLFANAAEYRALYPTAPWQEVAYHAPRLDHGEAVHRARARLADRAGLEPETIATSTAALPRGSVDRVTETVVEGWIQCPDTTEARVLVEILQEGEVIGTALANRHRPDLAAAGLGSGNHAFEFTAPHGIQLSAETLIIRRAIDGAALAPLLARAA